MELAVAMPSGRRDVVMVFSSPGEAVTATFRPAGAVWRLWLEIEAVVSLA